MPIRTGTVPDPDYHKGYDGNLSAQARAKCTEFSKAYFKCNKGFGKRESDIASIKPKIQEIEEALKASSDCDLEYKSYLEFLVNHKGNYEFMIPYYKLCKEKEQVPDTNIEVHHYTYRFGLMGTVDEILADL